MSVIFEISNKFWVKFNTIEELIMDARAKVVASRNEEAAKILEIADEKIFELRYELRFNKRLANIKEV